MSEPPADQGSGAPLLDRRAVLAGAGLILQALPDAAFAAPPASPVARTRAGPVRGQTDRGVHVFKGVRYGADTAPRRFMPALPPTPWREVRDALEYGPASPQRSSEPNQSEDCLFLNVWTRGLRDGARRPVMVYVHGGAHANGSGSSPLYDGVNLCRRGDVVVVTVNHRLNVFGYNGLGRLVGGDLADSGNVGNLDLVLALRWVRDNIAEFGGDPGRVMVFGQSGGGAKLVTLMAMPIASGLFHRVATMSGQHVTAMGPLHAAARARAFLAHLGITPQRIADVRTMPWGRLVEALNMADPILGDDRITFWSVVDQRSLRRHPFFPDAPREAAHIPLIIGNTRDETRAFLGGDPKNFELTWDELPDRLGPEMVVDIAPEHVVARYRELYPSYSPSEVFFAASTAGRSWRGHLEQAEARARIGAPAWMYQLDYGSPLDGGRMRAFHAFDIPLVFDNLEAPGSRTGTGPASRAVAARMSESFIAFARTGKPDAPALPAWPKYELARRATMIFDTTPRIVNDPRGAERRLFGAAPYLKPGT